MPKNVIVMKVPQSDLTIRSAEKESLMTKIETRIRAQFNAMETLVSGLNATGDYLTQQMDMLSKMTTGN